MRRLLFALFVCMAIGVHAQEENKTGCFMQVRFGGPQGGNILVCLPKFEGYYNIGTVLNEKKEKIEAKEIVDILTFVASKGWEYVTQYTEVSYGKADNWFIFKKKVKSIREAYEDFPLHTNVDGPQH